MLRDFMVTMSITDQFDADLCAAITERKVSTWAIDELVQRNFLVSTLADQRRWYRFHGLFLSFLRRQLDSRSANERAELHRGAGEWLAAHSETEAAMPHLLAGGAEVRAAEVMIDDRDWLFVARPGSVYEWIGSLSERVMVDYPSLYLAAINSAYIAASASEAMGWIDRYERARGGGDTEVRRYTVQCQRLWGLMMLGRLGDASTLVDEVLETFDRLDTDRLAGASHLGDLGMGAENAGVLLATMGDYERAIAAFERVVERHEDEGWPVHHAALASYGMLGELAWLAGGLATARAHTDRALALITDDDVSGYTLMGRAMAVLLDPEAATVDQIGRMLQVADRFDSPFTSALSGLAEAAYQATNGHRIEAQLALNDVRDRLAVVERSPLSQRLIRRVEPLIARPSRCWRRTRRR